MGIPLNDPTFIYSDNQSVSYNTTVPESTLKKKFDSIWYHYVREGVTRYKQRTKYIKSEDNSLDRITSSRQDSKKRTKFIRMNIYDIYGRIQCSRMLRIT